MSNAITRSLLVVAGSILTTLPLATSAQQPASGASAISADFPYESHYVEVLGSRMHYVDEGEGEPILFLHGNPTSSYLWRNVIPFVTDHYRAIAVDLIGMGKSDKPDLAYTYQDHKRYVDAFIEALDLSDITLVIHDWGSVLGFDYAMGHEDNVVGIAFMEAIVPPRFPTAQPMGGPLGRYRTEAGEQLILEQNQFVEVILPASVVRGLTEEEMEYYRAPYPTPESRLPTLQWPRELPAAGEPARNVEVVNRIGEWMQETDIPMLHFWARPGALNNEAFASAMIERVQNIQSSFIGAGRHYVQEDQPEAIGRTLADWRRRIAQVAPTTITNGQGEIAGEVTTTSVILQSRLTRGSTLVNGDLPGARGTARFEVATTRSFADSFESEWLLATADHDFIVKTKIDGLNPGTRYYYRVIFGADQERVRAGPTRTFATLDGAEVASEVDFVVVTGMRYNAFQNQYRGPDKHLGYPALETILDLRPDFFVATGDNVYYDVPFQLAAKTRPELRQKWHEQFVQPRYAELFAQVPTYWEKDDHDSRYNDSDNTGDAEPSVELGIAMFLEQVPVVDPDEANPLPYRTHRINKDLQIWLTEGRDYRSPNMMTNGPGKTLWGAEQYAWLRRTLLESDATFKILISPTPMIGPDDAEQAGRPAEGHDPVKRDNHADPSGFQYERDHFFSWLTDNGFLEDQNFYIICGDRHWQYHSIDPTGFEEFSTGALVDGNSRLGRSPGDPGSTDPDALIDQPYTQTEPSGGFLHVTITPGERPTATMRFHDERGVLLHTVVKVAR